MRDDRERLCDILEAIERDLPQLKSQVAAITQCM